MPRITTYQSSAAPQTTTAVDRAQNYGIGIIGDILDQIKQTDARDKLIRDKQWVIGKTIEFKQEQLKKQQELEMSAGAGADGHAERVAAQYDTDVDQWVNSNDAPSEDARMAFKTHLQDYGLGIKSNAYQFQSTESARYSHETVLNSINTLGNQLTTNPETYDDVMKSSQDMVATLRGKIPESKILEIQNDAAGVLNWAASSGRMKKNPYQELAMLNSGQMDDKFSIEKKQSLINAAEAEIRGREADAKQAQAQQYQAFNSDLEIRAIKGDLPINEIEALYHSGKLRPEDRAQYTRAALSGIEGKEKKAESLMMGNAFIRGEAVANPYSTDHVNSVNDITDSTIRAMSESGKSSREIMSAVNGISVKTGIVPKAAVNFIEGGLMNSNDPEIIVNSANALIDTVAKNPVTQNSFNEKARTKAHLVQTLTTYMTPEQAVTKANELFYQDDSVKAERKQNIEKIEAETKKNNGDFGFEKWYGNEFDEGFFDMGASPATAGLKQQYMDAVRVAYQDTGNMETSVNIVQSKMKGNIGYSSVGGTRKLTMHPPERFYSLPMDTPEKTTEWQTDQLASFALSRGFKNYQRIEVSPHNTLKYGKDGMPNYKITVIDESGIPVIVRDGNQPAVWRPNTEFEYKKRFSHAKAAK